MFPVRSKTSNIPTVTTGAKIGPLKKFLLESGLAHGAKNMSQRALIPEGLKNRDVEVRKLSQRPPLSFVPNRKSESEKNKTTIKVKISDELTESVEAFDGTSPEQYVELMDCFSGISRKKGLLLAITNAVENLKTEKLFWDVHTQNRPNEVDADKVHHEDASANSDEAGSATVSPEKAKAPGGGRNRAVTNLQFWQGEGERIKASIKQAGETRDKAVKALFSVFESVLGQAASGRWDQIVAKICVGGSATDETSSDGRSVSRFRFCQRELMLEVFSQDAAEKQREYLLFH